MNVGKLNRLLVEKIAKDSDLNHHYFDSDGGFSTTYCLGFLSIRETSDRSKLAPHFCHTVYIDRDLQASFYRLFKEREDIKYADDPPIFACSPSPCLYVDSIYAVLSRMNFDLNRYDSIDDILHYIKSGEGGNLYSRDLMSIHIDSMVVGGKSIIRTVDFR